MVDSTYNTGFKPVNEVPGGPGSGAASVGKALQGSAKVAMQNSKAATEESNKQLSMSKEMNKSFQGMQAQASIAQKIIGGTMDFFAIGVSKTQKEFVGALKKIFSEGDIAGGIDALINMKYQFVDLKQLAGPFAAVFGPFNKMLEAVAGFATQYIVNSKEFQDFINYAFSEAGMKELARYGEMLGKIVMQFVDMDWEAALNALDHLMTGLGNFIDFVKNAEGWGETFAGNWNNFWNPNNTGAGGGGYTPGTF